jgi:hypothetical protein
MAVASRGRSARSTLMPRRSRHIVSHSRRWSMRLASVIRRLISREASHLVFGLAKLMPVWLASRRSVESCLLVGLSGPFRSFHRRLSGRVQTASTTGR